MIARICAILTLVFAGLASVPAIALSPSDQEAFFVQVEQVGQQIGYAARCGGDRDYLDHIRSVIADWIDAKQRAKMMPDSAARAARARFDFSERVGYREAAQFTPPVCESMGASSQRFLHQVDDELHRRR